MRFMKQFLACLAVFLFLLGFSACAEDLGGTEQETPSEASGSQSGHEDTTEVGSDLANETDTGEAVDTGHVTVPETEAETVAPSGFTPDYGAGKANAIGNTVSNSRYASQDNWIYFSPSVREISKFRRDSGRVVSVYRISSGNIMNISVVGDWIYFCVDGESSAGSYIAKVRTDGSGFEKVLSSVTVGDMLVVGDTIYFTIFNSEYTDFAKDCSPLYSVSVNGGVSKQIHDGYVSSIAADSTHVYFLQTTEEGKSTVYRMKHDASNKLELYANANTNYFILCDSKLYFLAFDRYSDECTIASISTGGGSYTTYGKVPIYSEWLYIVGKKAFYSGMPFSEGEPSEAAGVVEYDMSTKKYKVIKEDYEMLVGFGTADLLIVENYQGDTLKSLSIYDPATSSWKDVSV